MPDKVIKGTKDRKNFQIVKGPSDTRQIRCTNKKCNNLAIQVHDGRGGHVYECTTCKTRFAFSKI